jgi:hypothetical protein
VTEFDALAEAVLRNVAMFKDVLPQAVSLLVRNALFVGKMKDGMVTDVSLTAVKTKNTIPIVMTVDADLDTLAQFLEISVDGIAE